MAEYSLVMMFDFGDEDSENFLFDQPLSVNNGIFLLNHVIRACLNFPHFFSSASLELLFGLFPCFYSSHSPLCSSLKQKNILKKNSQKNAEQNLNRLYIFKQALIFDNQIDVLQYSTQAPGFCHFMYRKIL